MAQRGLGVGVWHAKGCIVARYWVGAVLELRRCATCLQSGTLQILTM